MISPEEWKPSSDPLFTLKELSQCAAPSGHEERLGKAIQSYLNGHGYEVSIDRLGQLEVVIGEQDADLVVMVVAHMDEVGLVVRRLGEDGFIRVHRLGGMPERVLPGTPVQILSQSGDIPAVIGTKAHHLTAADEKYVGVPAAKMYLDVGASNLEDLKELGIRVGDPLTYVPTWVEHAGGFRVSGKSMDNRTGVLALLMALEMLSEMKGVRVRVHAVFSCLEEFNLQGPLTAAKRIQPDAALVMDIVPATDTPDLEGEGSTELGCGPSISRYAFHGRGTLGGLIPHPGLVKALEESALRSTSTFQYDAVIGCLNDSSYLPMSTGLGVATVSLNIPCRYTHSPVETIDILDVKATADLVVDFLVNLKGANLTRW